MVNQMLHWHFLCFFFDIKSMRMQQISMFKYLYFKGKISIHSDMYFFVNYKISIKKQNDFLKNRQDNNL